MVKSSILFWGQVQELQQRSVRQVEGQSLLRGQSLACIGNCRRSTSDRVIGAEAMT